ncbi:MAG: class I SAM-dependent methyltransferase [Cyanothece sp. SIO1E1]|nr:class I SAM-dependent methyltransferase [Cyanothece sp. SIO1E1]
MKNEASYSWQQDDLSKVLVDRSAQWESQIATVAKRFNQEYRNESFDLPAEVETMPIFHEWAAGLLATKIASPFWEIAKPRKHQRCLDIGCGVSFLIYPWRDWDALFYGQDTSIVAQENLNARGPQLNSKLFKGVRLAAAHRLEYEPNQFDFVVATGFSCYYNLDYWAVVMAQVKQVLKPEGTFVFDVINPELPLAENWAILEMYLGAEVFLESADDWKKTIKAAGAKILNQQQGELFQLYKVRFL